MKRLVVLGRDGQLGRAFSRVLEREGRPYVAYGRGEVNLLEPSSLEFSLDGAQAVVNCAAYTNVDAAEADEVAATKVNAEAVGILARRCHHAGIPLVHFSTDYVFDGCSTTPYPVDHPVAPVNAYGRSKALGEALLRESGAAHILIRTSWVYAPWGNNFVLTMARLLKQKTELRVVDDQRGRPTHASGLAERALALLDGGHRGCFHITDGGQCSWFDLASAVSDVIGAECRLVPCASAEFLRPAYRPAYSVLDTKEADEILSAPVHYTDRLKSMNNALLEVV